MFLSHLSRKVVWGKNIGNKMAAEDGLDLSAFIVEKGTEAEEGNTDEVAEISLSSDLEAEDARKEELREQASKVRKNVPGLWKKFCDVSRGINVFTCSLAVVYLTSWS